MEKNIIFLIFFMFAVSNISLAFAASVDKKIPKYKTTYGVSGNITSIGSDTLANLMTFWTEEFKKLYPNVKVQVQAAGSSTAPPALTEGTSDFGPMSRKMKGKEIGSFEKKWGYKPTRIAVAIDALVVYVNRNNPLNKLSLAEVDAIFSSTRNFGYRESIDNWGQVGLTGTWKGRSIQLYGRNSVSGTYGYFKKKALRKGDYKSKVNEQPGSASVVQSVGKSLNAIGYSGIGYKTSEVKAVAIAKKGKKYIKPTIENAANGNYPLSRKLYIYINKKPGRKLDKKISEFIKLILSKQGQEIVVKDGYVPLRYKDIKKQLSKIR